MTTHAVDIDEIQTTRGEKLLAVVLGMSSSSGSCGLRRERYRTALDADQPAQTLRAEYREAERALAAAEARVTAAQARVAETQPAAVAAEERRSEEQRRELLSDSRLTFLLRLALMVGVLGGAYGLLIALRGSRYFTLALAGVGAGAVLALVFAGDYVEDYVEVGETGPVVLSAAGIALTVGTFWGLQRYLQKRIPLRRLRKHECPFCGFPVGTNTSCEGCGRSVAGSCSECGRAATRRRAVLRQLRERLRAPNVMTPVARRMMDVVRQGRREPRYPRYRGDRGRGLAASRAASRHGRSLC